MYDRQSDNRVLSTTAGSNLIEPFVFRVIYTVEKIGTYRSLLHPLWYRTTEVISGLSSEDETMGLRLFSFCKTTKSYVQDVRRTHIGNTDESAFL